jgi:hypothetical protein
MSIAPHESRLGRPVCDFSLLDVVAEPFPHVTQERFIAPEVYRESRESFPHCPPNTGPTGYSLYWGARGTS